MMNCEYCGTRIPDGCYFCPECGKKAVDHIDYDYDYGQDRNQDMDEDEIWYLCNSSGKQFGPYTRSRIIEYIESGKIGY